MKRPKKHHFLSQTYLENFAQPDRPTQLWQIEKASGKTYSVAIRDAAQQADFHTFEKPDGTKDSHSIETALSNVESQHSSLVRLLMNHSTITPEQRHLLSRFVNLMMFRVPATRDFIEQQHLHAAQALIKSMVIGDRLDHTIAKYPELGLSKYPPHIQQAHITKMKEMVEKNQFEVSIKEGTLLGTMFELAEEPRALGVLDAMRATVLECSSDIFFTVDQPVAIYHPTAERSVHGIGLIDKATELTLSLSSRHLLRLDWTSRDQGVQYLVISDSDAMEFNRRMAVMSQEYLFSGYLNDAVRELIVKNRNNFAGSRVESTQDAKTGTAIIMTQSIPVFAPDKYP